MGKITFWIDREKKRGYNRNIVNNHTVMKEITMESRECGKSAKKSRTGSE